MNPEIQELTFGKIVIANKEYKHDVVIGLDGAVKRRQKELSKEKYGTSHKISREEAETIYQHGVEQIIIGSGKFGRVFLSNEAKDFFRKKNCGVELYPSGKVISEWNRAGGNVIGLFHITC